MAKKNSKKIGIRKYVNYVLLMVAIVLVCLLGVKMWNSYKEGRLDQSVLMRSIGTIQFDDVDNARTELVSDDFIFVSFVKSDEVRKLESKMKKTILKYELQKNFYYLDATDLMLEEDYIDLLNEKFILKGNNKIEALPALIYYKDGKVMKTLSSSSDKILTHDEFVKLLDNYELIERN